MPETTSGPNTFPGEAAGTRAAPRSAKGFFASIGAVGAAFFASLCCVGPLLFVTFGVGAGLAATFEPLRPLFTVVAAGLLALGFYVVYGRKSGAACTAESGATRRRARTRDQVILWSATLLALVLWSFPFWSKLLV